MVVAVLLAAAPSLIILLYAVVPPPVTPLMVLRWADGAGLDYRWVPLRAISPSLLAAVVAAEDNHFCSHFGFDVDAIADEVDDWLAGERPRGASTITQQTAKNILLWPGRDLVRKGLEAVFTLRSNSSGPSDGSSRSTSMSSRWARAFMGPRRPPDVSSASRRRP